MGHSSLRHRRGDETTDSDAGGGAPGKRTLTSAVQRRARAPSSTPAADSPTTAGASVQLADDPYGFHLPASEQVHAAAARGVESPSQALPHGDAIQRSFGSAHDVGGIQAHVGGAATEAAHEMGASAYATGDHVAFASAPDLHTAAHEAAHVVQQARGVNLLGGVGDAGDVYEQHADAVADRVVAGQSAADLLAAGPSSSGSGPAVQHKLGLPGFGRKDKKGKTVDDDLAVDIPAVHKNALTELKALFRHMGAGELDAYYGGDASARESLVVQIDVLGDRVKDFPRPKKVEADPRLRARYKKLSDLELNALIAYTNVYYHAFNGILRGLLTSDLWKPLVPLAEKSARGLTKVRAADPDAGGPAAAADDVDGGATPEPPLPPPAQVYRGDKLNPVLNSVFTNHYKQGSVVREPGFLSTSRNESTASSFASSAPAGIVRTIRGLADHGKDLADISSNDHEAEILMPPGLGYRIDSITATLPTGEKPVTDPLKDFPNDNLGATDDPKAFNQKGMVWRVDATVVGKSEAKKAEKKQSKRGAAGGPSPAAAPARPAAPAPQRLGAGDDAAPGAADHADAAPADPLDELAPLAGE